jgi:hypothetical protein
LPSRLDINSVDRFTVVLHAQMTILPSFGRPWSSSLGPTNRPVS